MFLWPYEVRAGRRFCSPACHDASRRNTPEMFWANVEKTAACWWWRGTLNPDGYGRFHLEGEQLAHRIAYRLTLGPIPAGRCLDHLCRNRACVNPAHVEATTLQVNILRGAGRAAREARATHCLRGHPFDETNTLIRKDGGRFCRACGRVRGRAYRERRKGATPSPPGAYCRRGHPFDAANTRIRPDGRRACRACARLQARDKRARARTAG
jgi:hypothetical protein